MRTPHKSEVRGYHNKRRGVRMNSRVPVAIEWEEPTGGTQRAEAFTRVVSPYGCLVVLPKGLAIHQPLRVFNAATKENIAAVVVWKGSQQPEGWELGIALVQPPADFWGLDL
jgi:hypothetical protein